MATAIGFEDTVVEEEAIADYDQTDGVIVRDRAARTLVAVVSPFATLFMGYVFGVAFASFFKLPTMLGTSLGLGLGALAVLWLIPKLYIVNDAVSAFVTVNLLETIMSKRSALVTYGPGFHFSFPWEKRSGGNNADLSEQAENFTFEVQATKEGGTVTIKGKYSVRLRPDIKHLPEFLGGVASIASDLGDIISAKIVEHLAKKSVKEILVELPSLNEMLAVNFKHGKKQHKDISDFEKRFGVIIGDVTVSELLPSKEVQKALDGASESAALDGIVARSLGYPNIEAVHAAVAAETLTSEHVAYATENAMAMTDNLHGLDLKRQTFTLRLQGDPDLIDAAKALAPVAPAIIGALTKGAAGNQSKGKR